MKKLYYLSCLLVCLFFGCESSDDIDPIDPIIVEIIIPSEFLSIELDPNELSKTITFTATSNWEISLSETTKLAPTWLSVSPMSGTAGSASLSLTLSENKSIDDRYADITISSDGITKTISVTQKAFTPELALSKTSETVAANAGSFTLDVTANTSWIISDIPEWITVSPISGEDDETITLSYDANKDAQVRSATIKFSTTAYDNIETFTLYQSVTQLEDLEDGGSLIFL